MRADCLPHVSVAIQINGNTLQEYPADSEDAMVALSYVEIVAGAEFSVVLVMEPKYTYRYEDLRYDVLLDGYRVASHIAHPARAKRSLTKTVDSVHEYADGFRSCRNFTFAQHRSTESKPDSSLIAKLKEIGEVSVVLTRCCESYREATRHNSVSKFAVTSRDGIPEKAMKGRAISHHAELGEASKRKKARNEKVHVTYPFGWAPIATYTFRYRSRRDLEIEGIIKSRPLLPLEDQAPENLTPEEARELARRMRAEKETPAMIKPEPGTTVKPGARAKRQHSDIVGLEDKGEREVSIISTVALNTKRARTAGASSVEVLDLTGE